jgi:acyl-CoA synthetase (AMP-forming)/AMP-acid ligase II
MNGNLAASIDSSAPPDREALIVIGAGSAERRIGFAELRTQRDAIAAALAALALPAGSRIALAGANDDLYVAAFLGVLAAGHVACPINVKLPPAAIERVLQDAGAAFALCDAAHGRLIPPTLGRMSFDEASSAGLAAPMTPLPRVADDLAFLMYTSGSTGEPKGVPITHGGYLWGVRSFEYERARAAGTRSLVAAPLHHMNAQSAALVNLYLGATTVLLRRFDIDLFCSAIETYRVEEITGVPTLLALALNRAEQGVAFERAHVTMISIGSAPLTESLCGRICAGFPNAAISNGYGTTETGIVSFGPHPAGLPRPPLALGVPMPGVGARLVGGPDEAQGVLELRTPMMARGYWRRPDLTAEKFVNGWYSTGDVMRRDADGFYYFVERADDMFVSGGNNVHPQEVERLLEQHPDVLQAAVVPLEHAEKGMVPVAFVVLRDKRTTIEELRQFALDRGAAYAHPRRIELVDELPLAGTNKIDRKALGRRAVELWGAAAGRGSAGAA